MAGLRHRLKRLEDTCEASSVEVWSPPAAYARLREEVRAETEADIELGQEPLFRIDEDGIIRARSDNRPVRHTGDYIGVLDEQIARDEDPCRDLSQEEENLFKEWQRRVSENLRRRGVGC